MPRAALYNGVTNSMLMISHKFAALSAICLARFIDGTASEQERTEVLDAVESPTDLWMLANMMDSHMR